MPTRQTTIPPPDEKLHAVLLSDGLELFAELIKSGDFWIFAADFTAKNLMQGVMRDHYSNSLPGDAHSLVLPVTAPPIVLVALSKRFMTPKQLSKQLRRHVRLHLSAAETAERDLFVAVAGFRVPLVTALIKHITGESSPFSWAANWPYGCQN